MTCRFTFQSSRVGLRREAAAWVVAALITACQLGACSSESTNQAPPCTAGDSLVCSGPNGCDGVRACRSDGSGYGECVCKDGGAGSGGTAGSGGSPGGGAGGSPGGGGTGATGGLAGTGGASDAALDADAPIDAPVDAPTDTATDATCGGANLATDPKNCGACGYACVGGRSCAAGRCTPAWLPLPATGAPTPRVSHAAVALGGKALFFGGSPFPQAASFADGAAYDPATGSWSAISSMSAGRCGHAAVSGGAKAYVFGGLSNCASGTSVVATTEAFDGAAWSSPSPGGAPGGRYNASAAWTGTRMFVFGGSSSTASYTAQTALLDPGGNAWSVSTCALSGCERAVAVAFVDSGFVRLMGGAGGNAPAGLQFNLSTSAWSAWALPAGTPTLYGLSADDGARLFVPTDGGGCGSVKVMAYSRATNSWTTDSAPAVTGLAPGPSAWVGGEMITWGGSCGGAATAVGGRYQPPAP